MITKRCREYRSYNGVLFIFLMVSSEFCALSGQVEYHSIYNRTSYFFFGWTQRTDKLLTRLIFFFFLFINDINLVRSQGEKEQQQQNIHRDNQIKEKESGQAYLILHADTLLILKCAVALCVTGSNYRRRKKLELRSAPCSTRQRLNDVLSKRWFNRNVFARMRFVYIAAADRPIYLLVGIKIEYKKKMQKN